MLLTVLKIPGITGIGIKPIKAFIAITEPTLTWS